MPKRSAAERDQPAFDLKAAREAQGMNQSECADFLFASQASVARWEADGSLPQIYRAYWNLKFPPKRKRSK